MSKKEFIQQIIQTFEENHGALPTNLREQFRQIKEKLSDLSDQDVDENMTAAVTAPSEEQPFDPDKLSYLLYESFPIMEKLAKEATENQYELLQATNQLRGELGMATDPPFPE